MLRGLRDAEILCCGDAAVKVNEGSTKARIADEPIGVGRRRALIGIFTLRSSRVERTARVPDATIRLSSSYAYGSLANPIY